MRVHVIIASILALLVVVYGIAAEHHTDSSQNSIRSSLNKSATKIRNIAVGIADFQSELPAVELKIADIQNDLSRITDLETDELLELREKTFNELEELRELIQQKATSEKRNEVISQINKLTEFPNNPDEKGMSLWVKPWSMAKSFFVWLGAPLIIFIAVLAFLIRLMSKEQFRNFVLSRFGKLSFSAFGVSLALENVKSDVYFTSATYKVLQDRVSEQYRIAIGSTSLNEKTDKFIMRLQSMLVDANYFSKKPSSEANLDKEKFRCCLFVPSYIQGYLIQATPYSNENFDNLKVGRAFSIRYGIIGMSFRSRENEFNADVENTSNELIKNWGLTHSEAERQSSKQGEGVTTNSALVGIPLMRSEKSEDPLGVVFFDIFENTHFSHLSSVKPRNFRNAIRGLDEYKSLVAEIESLRNKIDFENKTKVQEDGY